MAKILNAMKQKDKRTLKYDPEKIILGVLLKKLEDN